MKSLTPARCAVLLALALARVSRADAPSVIDCPWYPPNQGGDFGVRGFYTGGYPGTSLKTVTLYLSFPVPGSWTLSLAATAGTFDGAALGTATAVVNATGTDVRAVVFDFGSVAVTEGSIVAFKGAVVSRPGAGAVVMQDVTEPTCRMTETTGTDAPLSSFRRGGVATLITGDVATTFSHRSNLPASASIHGANGAFFHTDVWVHNPLSTDVSVTATFHCFAGMSCGSGTASFQVPAGQSVTFSDVDATLFGAPETAGAIQFAYSTPNYLPSLRVVSRTYTPNLPNPTNGAAVFGQAGIQAAGAATYLGIGNNGGDRSAGFRTNAGWFNPSGHPATVTFTLTAKDGTPIGAPVVQSWSGGEARQVNDVFAAAGAGATVTTDAVLHVSSTLPGFPYVTVIDNQTGDSVIQQ